MKFKMSWTLDGNGGNTQVPSWDNVLKPLEQLQGKEGSLTLDMLNSVDGGAEMLQARTESGYYLMTLGEIYEDEYLVRTYWNPTNSDTEMMILGDRWPKRQLTKDFDLVVTIFKEFFDTGNVSRNFLSQYISNLGAHVYIPGSYHSISVAC